MRILTHYSAVYSALAGQDRTEPQNHIGQG